MTHAPQILNAHPVTMSSRDIADLTGKRHDNVMADIRVMLAELDLATPDFSGVYVASNGQRYACFNLPRRECDILVAGYSIKYRAAIVDRWRELEAEAARPQLPDFTNPAAAARAWADEVEQREQLALEHDRLSSENAHLRDHFAEGMRIVDFARSLNGVNTQKVQQFLVEKGWIRRDGFGFRVNCRVRDRYVAERTRRFRHPITDEEQESHYPVLLKAGAVRLFKMYTAGELPMKATWNGQYGHGAEVFR